MLLPFLTLKRKLYLDSSSGFTVDPLIQPPATVHPGRQQMVAYVLCFLSLGEETQTEFLAPSFDLVVVGIWKIFLSVFSASVHTHT